MLYETNKHQRLSRTRYMLLPLSVPIRSAVVHKPSCFIFFFFFNDTATTEIYTLSLHDALPISSRMVTSAPRPVAMRAALTPAAPPPSTTMRPGKTPGRSEEHTSELQSRLHLVCRLLLEKKKKKTKQECYTRQISIKG